MARSRIPLPTVGLVGVGGAGTHFGRLLPAQSEAGLIQGCIIPQVIQCPWSTDEAGVSIPAGTLAVRAILTDSMDTQYAQPLTDDDSWILVPSSLPSGWTQRGRDSQRGAPAYDSSAGGYVYRGCPVYRPRYSAGFSFPHQIFFSGGYPRIADDFTAGPLSAGASYPQRRDTGGLSDVAVYPLNESRHTVQCFMMTGGGGDYRLYGLPSHPPEPGGIDLLFGGCWFNPSFGWRNIRIKFCLVTTNSSPPDNIHSCYVHVSHNADGLIHEVFPAQGGDTVDHVASVGPSWTLDSSGGGLWTWSYTFDLGAFQPTGTPTLTSYYVSFIQYFHSFVVQPIQNLYGQGDQYAWLSPRVDIPLWFTVTGRNLVAPGGLPP